MNFKKRILIYYRFIARVEEILSEWKLNGPEISNTEVR
jgi:hypothetical protein